jgi:hypothetical protein
MLLTAKQLHGYKLGALDGEIGHAKGFYFDDKDWVARYLVADTGSWIPGRRVLISPYALGSVFPGEKLIEVKLTREKVWNSPSIDFELPIARQHEIDYYRYYNWPAYWHGPGIWGFGPIPAAPPWGQSPEPPEGAREPTEAPALLRSTQEVTGYVIHAQDGDIGHVEDFLVDDVSWAIRFLVVATGRGWWGKNILVPPSFIERVNWEEASVFVNLSREEIQHGPAWE